MTRPETHPEARAAPMEATAGAPADALVALGANLPGPRGAPAEAVAAAMDALAPLGAVTARSRLWRSPSWPPGGPPYVNAALRLATPLPPGHLLRALHAVEAAFARVRAERWGPRTLDLDLLGVGDLVIPDAATQAAWADRGTVRVTPAWPDGLVLPHPRLQDRAFVLLPLLEVAPDWRHPLLGSTVREMAAALPPDRLEGVAPL